ncbi:hypothetical protein GC722_02025 [Auraticoccus sp. F435]|uniref:Uncharacterized protein n=1 Tax=Auraticoccus cholistanensis TaxID=2656650 RepID=A0A6A9UUD2_9ACTN|nr:hypothetical protein [Auraticoccus cholistanensis]MVA74817.1 hypothetical protein [Auraticoccus cholistanensis]
MSGWQLPAEGAPSAPAAEDWVMPAPMAGGTRSVVRTGPSGLLLGTTRNERGETSSLAVRLFRNRPTRVFLAVPEYVSWVLAFRCVALGAHLTVLTGDPRRWGRLVRAVTDSGGSVDLLGPDGTPPGSGRPYRPSLVLDDVAHYDGSQAALGPWQAVLVNENAAASGAVFQLRSCDMAVVGPCDARVTENLRRAYALGPRQVRDCTALGQDEVVLAMPRRLLRVQVPPTPTEYGVLFRA